MIRTWNESYGNERATQEALTSEDLNALESACSAASDSLIGRRYGNGDKRDTAEQMKGWIADSIDASLADPCSVDDFFVLETKEGFVVCILGNGPTSEQNGKFFMQAWAKVPALIASHRELAEALAAATKRAGDAERERDAALAVLRDVEGVSRRRDEPTFCPVCRLNTGHHPNCALAACLKGVE